MTEAWDPFEDPAKADELKKAKDTEASSPESGFGFNPPDRGSKASDRTGEAKAAEESKAAPKAAEEDVEAKAAEEVKEPIPHAAASSSKDPSSDAGASSSKEPSSDAGASSSKEPSADAGASSSSAAEVKGFQVGCEVKIHGIKAKPELNGLKGTLAAFDEEKGRWQVKVPDGSTKLLKEDNLELVVKAPPPPPKKVEKRRPLPAKQLTAEEAVEWVNTSIDEFEALLLPLQLEEDLGKIRKQYRQLSLLVHPDKNKHPDAEAAFKKMFGAMETLSDPMKQRTALRKAKRKATGSGPEDLEFDFDDDDTPWWAEASVDEMELRFREMEKKYEKMGFFGMDKKMRDRQTGVDEDLLWISVEAAKDLFDKDLALFVDSRNTSDFDVSHVRGAKCLPGHTMEQLFFIERHPVFTEVTENPEQNVIVYSDNGSKLSRCTNVAAALRQHSRVQAARVLRLTGGLNAWKRMGFPVYGDARALFAGQVLGGNVGRLGGMDDFMAQMMAGGR